MRKVWRPLLREGVRVARCTVARLRRQLGLHGEVRGKPVKTTVSDQGHAVPAGLRQPAVPGRTPEPALGLGLHACLHMDVFARRIVGWKVSRSARTDFVPDALEQALYARRPSSRDGLIHHSDRGVQ